MIERICQELYEDTHDKNLNSLIDGAHLIEFTKQVFNQGGYPGISEKTL